MKKPPPYSIWVAWSTPSRSAPRMAGCSQRRQGPQSAMGGTDGTRRWTDLPDTPGHRFPKHRPEAAPPRRLRQPHGEGNITSGAGVPQSRPLPRPLFESGGGGEPRRGRLLGIPRTTPPPNRMDGDTIGDITNDYSELEEPTPRGSDPSFSS